MKKISAKLVSHSGSDDLVITIAAVSYGKNPREMNNEEKVKFLRMLADGAGISKMQEYVSEIRDASKGDGVRELRGIRRKPEHFTPFAHPQITLEIEAPIPIRTHAFKSKMGFIENEISRRYTNSDIEAFDLEFSENEEDNKALKAIYKDIVETNISLYKRLVDHGVKKEKARFILPQGIMTRWYWTGSLYAYARFYNIRSQKESQEETRILAEEISKVIQELFPLSWEALTR